MAYKMIVLDLDGTLTNNKKEITPFDIEKGEKWLKDF